MACGNKAQRLVQITPIVRAPKKTEKPPKQPQFFHCAVCGFTTFRAKKLAGKHAKYCPGPQPIVYQIDRLAKCESCPNRKGKVCLLTKIAHQHLGRPGLIAVGVAKPECRCPIGSWERVLWNCRHCGQITWDEAGLKKCGKCGKS
jgi:hypothetical protein